MNRLTSIVSALALLSSIVGCKVGPNYKRPIVATPAEYRGALAPDIAANSAGATPLGAQKWNAVFTDPALQSLITETLKNNYEVKIAADRVLEQQAQLGVTRAGEFPTLSIGATQDALGIPTSLVGKANSGGSSGSSSKPIADKYYAGCYTASVAWNLDFWGAYRRQTEAARAQLRATEWAQQTTYSTLVESVAQSYYQLRELDALLQIAKDTAAARQQSLDLTNTLVPCSIPLVSAITWRTRDKSRSVSMAMSSPSVALPLTRFHKEMPRSQVKEEVLEALRQVGLEKDVKKMPVELSGGMKKRAGLARALILSPELVLVDEPSSGLDRITASEIDELLVRVKEERHATLVIVTHDVRSARRISDKIAVLDKGQLVGFGTAQELEASEHELVRELISEA